MTWQAWLTLGLLCLMFLALVRNLIPPDVAFMGGLAVVVTTGIITPDDAFHGFSNHGMITVAAMFVVAAGLRETGALHMLVSRILGSETSERAALARMTCPAAGLSAFLNNTPIVAIMLPEILAWCRRREIAPSRMLIPLSYATILGGVCTLIGTSTNLVVDGMMRDQGLRAMSLFELGKVGLPVAVVGLAFVLLVGPRILPDRKELITQLGESQREYIVEMIVEAKCPLIGRTIQEAGLRRLPGLFLIEIDRRGEIISPVAPSTELREADRLIFTGLIQTIVDLKRIPGLVAAEEKTYDLDAAAQRQRRLCEAVVSASFPELGKNVRNSDFRTRYDAVVVAVHRNGERLRKKIGDIILRAGDTLLLQTGPHFERTFRGSTDFYLVSEVRGSAPTRHDRAWIAIGVLLLLVVLLFTSAVPTAVAALLASGLMVLFRCVPVGGARRAIDWQVLLVIAAALGVGRAIDKSGLAGHVASVIIRVGYTLAGTIGVMAGIYLLTNLLTEVISHIGAAAVTFPIAMASAAMLGVDPRPFAITIAISASVSFATPIGYQTNLMVYGPGGYRFADFLRVGLPLNLLAMIVAVAIIPRVWTVAPLTVPASP
jgi:di/tricarboxylate transporter